MKWQISKEGEKKGVLVYTPTITFITIFLILIILYYISEPHDPSILLIGIP